MESHCWTEHETLGWCVTLRREDGLGCFAGALPAPLRAALTGDEKAWTEVVRGAGALCFWADTHENAHTAARMVVGAIEDGVLVAPGDGCEQYHILQESADPTSPLAVIFPDLYVLPSLARALLRGAAITGHWAVPYTGGQWRAVEGGRLWSDPPPRSSWLRTPLTPLTYSLAAGPALVRATTRSEGDACLWLPSGGAALGSLGDVLLVTHEGGRAAMYKGHGPRGVAFMWKEDGSLDVVAGGEVVWPSRTEREGYERRVWPVPSTALECPAALREVPTSAIGHISSPIYGVRWWVPARDPSLLLLVDSLSEGRYESVGANDYLVLTGEGLNDATVNGFLQKVLACFEPSREVHGGLYVREGDVAFLHVAARRAYRPLFAEAAREYGERRKVPLRLRHWLPLRLAYKVPLEGDSMPHLVPRNRWGRVLHESLEWARAEWWPEGREEPVYSDAEVAVWRACIARRFGDVVYMEDMEMKSATWHPAGERPLVVPFRILRGDGATYPGEQIVGTHALVRVGWGGVCRSVPLTASREDFSEDIAVRLARLNSLNVCRVLPTVVGERFGDLDIRAREGLTLVPMVAPCGAGKSTAALGLARVLADRGWRVLFVSPRTSVVEQTIALLRGLHFTPIDGRNKEALALPTAKSAVCCVTTIHSLHRLEGTFVVPQGPNTPPLALFIDEAVTAFTSDYNSHIIPAAKCEATLMKFLAGVVRMCVLMDANLTPHLVGNVAERYVYGVRKVVGSRLTHLSLTVHPLVATYNMVTLQRRTAMCYTAHDAPLQIFRLVRERLGEGRRVAIFCSRKKDLDVWHRALEGVVAKEEALYYCADTKVALGELCGKIQAGVRLFLYTSAAGAGVDLAFRDAAGDACEHFDTVAMVGASAPYLCPKDLEQAASRVRMTTELLVDMAGADVAGPLETVGVREWQEVMDATEEDVLARALRTASCVASLAAVADLDRSVWLCSSGGMAEYGDTSPYARLLAYNNMGERAIPFRCQAFVATLARVGYNTRLVKCPLPGDVTLDAAASLLRSELLCDVEEGGDLYNHVLSNRRRGALGLPLLLADEPYVQRVEECIKRLHARDTLDVARTVKRLLDAPLACSVEAWQQVVRDVVEEHGPRATREGRKPLGEDGVALREALTSGTKGKKVLQVLALYVSHIATGFTSFFPLFTGTHISCVAWFLPLLSRLGQGDLVFTRDATEWVRDANEARGVLYVPKDGKSSSTALGILNRYSVSFLGAKFYKAVKGGGKVDDENSRMALLAVMDEEEARGWLERVREETRLFCGHVEDGLPGESAPQERKRKRLSRVTSRIQIRDEGGEEERGE